MTPKQTAKEKLISFWEMKKLKAQAEAKYQEIILKPDMEQRIENFEKAITETEAELKVLEGSHKFEDRQKRMELEKTLKETQNNLALQKKELEKSGLIIQQNERQIKEADNYLPILEKL